jgi:hypothetical protein
MTLAERIRAALTLTRFQAIVGITAGFLSIGATVWGILFATRAPAHSGELVAIVEDARTAKPVIDATVELLTARDALITSLLARNGQTRQTLKEGAYRLRVSHPRFSTEVRQIQVLAGHSQEIRVRLAPRAADIKVSPLDKATEAVKKIFR